MGYKAVTAQLMSSLAFACAFVGVLVFCRIADKTGKRAFTLVASIVVSAIGYMMLIISTDQRVRFGGTCLIAAGNFPGAVLIISWMTMSLVGYTKRYVPAVYSSPSHSNVMLIQHSASALAFTNIISQAIAIGANASYIDPPICMYYFSLVPPVVSR
jgi:hypothetical protein